jgi:hypothetical protein
MIKDRRLLREFEDNLSRAEKPDFFRNLRIYEALYREAINRGVLPAEDPMEGMEFKIRFARALNSVR